MKNKKEIIELSLRIYLSISLSIYSLAKIMHIQFDGVFDKFKEQKVSELTGQELTWLFFGYSSTYEIIIGIVQLTLSLLLLFSRTKSISIIGLLPFLGNILLLNIFYDIKALSTISYYYIILFILCILNKNVFKNIYSVLLTSINYKKTKFDLISFFVVFVFVCLLFLISILIN